jgi:hypothetical protein
MFAAAQNGLRLTAILQKMVAGRKIASAYANGAEVGFCSGIYRSMYVLPLVEGKGA